MLNNVFNIMHIHVKSTVELFYITSAILGQSLHEIFFFDEGYNRTLLLDHWNKMY